MLRGRTRRDHNERILVEFFESVGCSVLKINEIGAPDLAVFHRGQVFLVEVKQPKGKLRETQQKFQARWRGPQIHIIRTVDEAVKLLSET